MSTLIAGATVTCTDSGQLNGTAATTHEAQIDWFGTVRGRIGYLITPETLLYGTGGLAYGRVAVSGKIEVTGAYPTFAGPPSPLPPGFATFSGSNVNVGFSVGGGIEGSAWLPQNWTWKLEYLYVDLGSIDTTTFLSAFGDIRFAPTNVTITTDTHFIDNIVRFGMNYKFN
jgi:outer membrane immunogenic protein